MRWSTGCASLRARAELPWLPDDHFVAHMAGANHHLVAAAARLEGWRPDVVHAHDWLVAWAGNTLHVTWGAPLVATVHATERGRGGGHLSPGQSTAINSVEWWLTYEATRVICCSTFMRDEVVDAFQLPADKVDVVPNGVDPEDWGPRPPDGRRGSDQPLIVSWGRVQYEKGFQTLVHALPEVRLAVPGVRAVIAGRGSYLSDLRAMAQAAGRGRHLRLPRLRPRRRAEAAAPPGHRGRDPQLLRALRHRRAGGHGRRRAGRRRRPRAGWSRSSTAPAPASSTRPATPGALSGTLRRVLAQPDTLADQQATAFALLERRYTWDKVAEATLPVYDAATTRTPH